MDVSGSVSDLFWLFLGLLWMDGRGAGLDKCNNGTNSVLCLLVVKLLEGCHWHVFSIESSSFGFGQRCCCVIVPEVLMIIMFWLGLSSI